VSDEELRYPEGMLSLTTAKAARLCGVIQHTPTLIRVGILPLSKPRAVICASAGRTSTASSKDASCAALERKRPIRFSSWMTTPM